MQNALMKIYIDTRTTAPRNPSPHQHPSKTASSATTARSATHSSPSSPTSAACATTLARR